jgi:hypothetical protein
MGGVYIMAAEFPILVQSKIVALFLKNVVAAISVTDFTSQKKEISLFLTMPNGPDGAAVISYTISQRANILDLRRPEDWETWKALEAKHTGRWISDKGLATWLVSQGVDGVYDNSMDGICIYNFDVLEDADFQSLKIAQKISNPAP